MLLQNVYIYTRKIKRRKLAVENEQNRKEPIGSLYLVNRGGKGVEKYSSETWLNKFGRDSFLICYARQFSHAPANFYDLVYLTLL